MVSEEVWKREQGYLKVRVSLCLYVRVCVRVRVCALVLCVRLCVRLVADEVGKREQGYLKLHVYMCLCACVHLLCVCMRVCDWFQMRSEIVNRAI